MRQVIGKGPIFRSEQNHVRELENEVKRLRLEVAQLQRPGMVGEPEQRFTFMRSPGRWFVAEGRVVAGPMSKAAAEESVDEAASQD